MAISNEIKDKVKKGVVRGYKKDFVGKLTEVEIDSEGKNYVISVGEDEIVPQHISVGSKVHLIKSENRNYYYMLRE